MTAGVRWASTTSPGGFNINNILYLGFDFGFRDIYQRLSLYYSEDYEGNYSGTAQQYLRQMNYNHICWPRVRPSISR